MPSRHRRALCACMGVLLLGVASRSYAGKHFVMPAAHAAKTYPAHDEHASEAVALGIDPYDTAEKSDVFSVHYNEFGFVPLFVVITNDSDQTVSLSDASFELITKDRSKIPPASDEDLYRRIARPTTASPGNPLPWPKKVKGGMGKDAQEEIQAAQFAARAVEPHSTQSGFMFFDVSGISDPLTGARFYMTGARNAKGVELLYFEVPLGK